MTQRAKDVLASAIRERRIRLGMPTMKALAERSGVTTRVLSDIANARRDNYSQQTLLTLDRSLGWVDGTCHELLSGHALTPTVAAVAPVFGEASCEVTAGMREHEQLAQNLLNTLSNRDLHALTDLTVADKLLLLSLVFGLEYATVDKIDQAEAAFILRSTKLHFEQEAFRYQAAKEVTHTAVLPKGDKRIDRIEQARKRHTDDDTVYPKVAAFDPSRPHHPTDIDEDEAQEQTP